MITYEPSIEKYIRERLSKQKGDIGIKKNDFLFLLPRMCREDRKRHLATTLTNKVFVLFEELWKEEATLQSSIAALRYFLEALIQAELLCKEVDYFEKIYYSVSNHKLKKAEVYLEKVKTDFRILEEYEKKENEIKEAYRGKTEEHQLTEQMQKEDRLYNDLDYELTISLDAAEFNSIDVQKMMLKEQFIPSIEKGIADMRQEYNLLSKKLADDLEFNRKFQIRGQASKVPKVLKETRTWKQKSIDAGLESEYQFVYEYTSSLLHCTSFSILTNVEIEKPEFIMLRSLANKYMARLLDRLHIFCGVPRNMKIIEMK